MHKSDSAIHIHVSILFQILFLFSLLHNTEQSSLCYIVGAICYEVENQVQYVSIIYTTYKNNIYMYS